ncbi:MAG TPA: hypothetical protein VK203_06180 [Nostocaceae cyanobacterium]|nr:hypothetical protein [Nostocaceae cyanobacterium]
MKHKGNSRHKKESRVSPAGREYIQISLRSEIAQAVREHAEVNGKYISYMTDAAFAMYLGIALNDAEIPELMPVNIPSNLCLELSAIASRTGISREQLINTAITQYLESLKKVLPVAS